jgi:hypothetical protein
MRMSINTPPSFRFSMILQSARPTPRLMSVEEVAGILPEDILPGEERFAVLEGLKCWLRREGAADFFFQITLLSPVSYC